MRLHFSQKQKQSGLLVYHHDGYTLNLLVLPKMWRLNKDGKRPNPWKFIDKGQYNKSLSVIAYEGEKHDLKKYLNPNSVNEEDRKHLDQWKIVLEMLLDALETNYDKSIQEEASKNTPDYDSEAVKSLGPLIEYHSKGGWKTELEDQSEDQSDVQSENQLSFQDGFASLFKLAIFCERQNTFDIDFAASEILSGVSLDSRSEDRTHDNILRLIAIQNYLREIEEHIHQIHQGYIRTTETLSTIRGSVTGRSLMMLDAGISLKAECRYNKFVPDTPLFQVLVTALDSIRRGFCFPKSTFINNLPVTAELQNTATRLRIQLSHITSLPHSIAQYQCQRIHLNRLQLHWKPALKLAKILLRNKPIQLHDSVQGNGGYMWTVNTSKVWESILVQSLKKPFEDTPVLSEVKGSQPWGFGKRPEADIVVNADDCLYIFDGKYKILANSKDKGRTKEEEYQMFSYSHVITHDSENKPFDQPNKHLGLVYPTVTRANEKYPDNTTKKNYARFTPPNSNAKSENASDKSKGKVSLELYYLPFPSTDDVATQKKWKDKMKKIGEKWTGIGQEENKENKPFYKKWENCPTE